MIVSSSDDREWYFFTCYDKNLNETNTRTVGDGLGFWKKENKDGIPIPIADEPNLCATKNYLTYFNVKEDKKAKKSHWQMEEYHLHIQCSKEGNLNKAIKVFHLFPFLLLLLLLLFIFIFIYL